MNSTMESRSQNAKINMNANGGQFPSTFPETFKDFFAMINEDEDQVEVVSNILEDKVIIESKQNIPINPLMVDF